MYAFGQHGLQGRGGKRCIGENEREHGRHIGGNHACALGHAIDGDTDTVNFGGGRGNFRIGVGCHNGAGRIHHGVRCGFGGQIVENSVEFMGIQRLANDAGRSQKNLRGFGTCGFGGNLCGQFNTGHAFCAGKGIGIAGIDHQNPRRTAGEVFAAPVHRGRGTFGAGKDTGNRRALIHQGHHDVGAAFIADAALTCGEAHPVNLREIRV